ncbi:hypothetical protein [Bacillus sp. OAE603]|uniref:hypothetical protein n=1 Tax=Gottfriedia sp. OAE603 TaxID=2663872 RepID=UPI00178996E5
MKKINEIIASFIIFFQLVLLTSCSNIPYEPKIKMDIIVRELTKNEYSAVGTMGLNNPSIHDFKKIVFYFEMKNSNQITYRNVNIPEHTIWKYRINSIDGERYWFGNYYKMGDSSTYHREIVYYSKGVSEEQIRKAFEDTFIRISYQTEHGESRTLEYSIGNSMEFK